MSYSGKTIHDFGILRKYTDTQYKLISMSIYHPAGTETERGYTAKGKAGNAEKLENSISRTRARIQELALCNPWDWFVTLTIDRKKQDRSDLKSFMKSFTQFFRDCRKKNRADMQYLFIPEHHQDGNWHLHGFLKGLPFSELHAFQRTEHLPYRILQRLDMNKATYTWKGYAEKFGYSVLNGLIRCHKQCGTSGRFWHDLDGLGKRIFCNLYENPSATIYHSRIPNQFE